MTSENSRSMEPDSAERFITQVMEQQRSLYAFILKLTHVISDADDVLQEVNLVLWRKRDEFEPGSNFQAWAFRIARFQVMAWHKRQTREQGRFSNTLVEQLADLSTDHQPEGEDRRTALANCMEKLRDPDRLLLKQRYGEGLSAAQISEADGRTRDSIYYALSRVHESLKECIRRRLRSDSP